MENNFLKVYGNNNHETLTNWFNDLWEQAQDFDAALMTELKFSWAINLVNPYDIYIKTLYELVKDRLENESAPIIWDKDMVHLCSFAN